MSVIICIGDARRTHPDSVSLVRPPNITIPKTLAALPNSQYATILPLTSGKRDFVFVAPSSNVGIVVVDKEAVLWPERLLNLFLRVAR
jgi:hypothetical protein